MSKEVLLDEKSKYTRILNDLSLEGARNPRALVQIIRERIPKLIEEYSMNFSVKSFLISLGEVLDMIFQEPREKKSLT